MMVSKIVIVSLLIYIQDLTGIVKYHLESDYEGFTSTSSGSGILMKYVSYSYCDDVYANYFACSFHHKLTSLTSNGLISITTDVMLPSTILLVDLENITIIGHDNSTVNCDNAGAIHFDHCYNCTIVGITWENCGSIHSDKPVIGIDNSSNIIIQNCSFHHSATQVIVLSHMSGNMIISGCNFTFNNHYEGHGVAIHYLSEFERHSEFQITISKCNFTHNGVTTNQSVVYIGPSSSRYMEQIFLSNSVFTNNQGTPFYI